LSRCNGIKKKRGDVLSFRLQTRRAFSSTLRDLYSSARASNIWAQSSITLSPRMPTSVSASNRLRQH
jgi:hypothetical protein